MWPPWTTVFQKYIWVLAAVQPTMAVSGWLKRWVHILDAQSHEIGPGISGLADLAKVDFSQIDPRIREVNVVGLSDVDNQLTGPTGATAVFGPQKGILPGQIAEDDQRLAHLAKLTTAAVGRDFQLIPVPVRLADLDLASWHFLGVD